MEGGGAGRPCVIFGMKSNQEQARNENNHDFNVQVHENDIISRLFRIWYKKLKDFS